MATLRLATRGSPLALAQARAVAGRLTRAAPAVGTEIVVVTTHGDEASEVPLSQIRGEGAFTAAVDRAVAEGRAELAVHSAKDLPSAALAPELVLAAVPERADARDCLVGRPLAGLAAGATVATGAARRRAQLAALRPDLRFVEARGNIARRLDQVPDGGATVVALAALVRLGIAARAAEVLGFDEMLPQVGQGALALTCRHDDEATRARLREIDDPVAHRAVAAERALLARVGAGCEAPIGAHARTLEGELVLEGLIASEDGAVLVRVCERGVDPTALGRSAAEALLSRGRAAGIEGLPQ